MKPSERIRDLGTEAMGYSSEELAETQKQLIIEILDELEERIGRIEGFLVL